METRDNRLSYPGIAILLIPDRSMITTDHANPERATEGVMRQMAKCWVSRT